MAHKILVVEEDPHVRESTGLLVRSLRYDVVLLGEADGILEAVRRERPDIVLQSLRMPGLNVAGLLASLRSNEGTAHIPIVFSSTKEDVAETARRYGAWGSIQKPYAPQELARLLERVLAGPPLSLVEGSPADVRAEVRTLFHGLWNNLAALHNYTVVLHGFDHAPDAAEALASVEDVVLLLEARAGRLRAYVDALVVALGRETAPAAARNSGPTARRQARRPDCARAASHDVTRPGPA